MCETGFTRFLPLGLLRRVLGDVFVLSGSVLVTSQSRPPPALLCCSCACFAWGTHMRHAPRSRTRFLMIFAAFLFVVVLVAAVGHDVGVAGFVTPCGLLQRQQHQQQHQRRRQRSGLVSSSTPSSSAASAASATTMSASEEQSEGVA